MRALLVLFLAVNVASFIGFAADAPKPPRAARSVHLGFKKDMKGVAGTSRNRIEISADYVRGHTNDFGMVIHELTHVVQAYPPNRAGWLIEGVADYIRLFHFEPNAPREAWLTVSAIVRRGE